MEMYDIGIIGAGISGLTAAIYGLRGGKKIIAFEDKSYGGQISTAAKIDNYPGLPGISGIDLAATVYNQAIKLGLSITYERINAIELEKDGIKRLCFKSGECLCRTVIIASGVTKSKLMVKGETELASKGVSYCATCDGAFYKGKVVIVCGGGNTALMSALYLQKICKTVVLVHRRSEFRGEQDSLMQLRACSNVRIVTDAVVTEICGSDSVKGIKYLDKNTKEEHFISADGVFVAVGQEPDTRWIDVIEKDEKGYILTNEDCETSVSGIFAAGDVRKKNVRQLTTAAADGTIAAMKCLTMLK